MIFDIIWTQVCSTHYTALASLIPSPLSFPAGRHYICLLYRGVQSRGTLCSAHGQASDDSCCTRFQSTTVGARSLKVIRWCPFSSPSGYGLTLTIMIRKPRKTGAHAATVCCFAFCQCVYLLIPVISQQPSPKRSVKLT